MPRIRKTMSEVFRNPNKRSDLLGWLIGWNWPARSATFPYVKLQEALTAGGFDPKMARVKMPLGAFRKAATRMSKNRVIDELRVENDNMYFQFTQKSNNNGDEIEFKKEDVLCLNLETGEVSCESSAELAKVAQTLVNEAIENRSVTEIGFIIDRLFKNNGVEEFPWKSGRGCHFVIAEFESFLGNISTFLNTLGCSLGRLPIAAGDPEGDKEVAEVVDEGLADLVNKLGEKINKLSKENRDDTFDARIEDIKLLRFKIESYAVYLGDRQASLMELLAEANESLISKIDDIFNMSEEEKEKIRDNVPLPETEESDTEEIESETTEETPAGAEV